MNEKEIRSICAAHQELAVQAVKLAEKHWRSISTDSYPLKPDISDEAGVSLTIDGDIATLHFTASGYDADYAGSFEFDAHCLWSEEALAAAVKRREEAHAAEQEAEAQRRANRERAEYEALRRKFEPSDLRSDIRMAMQITERIAAEDGTEPPAWTDAAKLKDATK